MKIIIENDKIFLLIANKIYNITDEFKKGVFRYKKKNNIGIVNISTDDKDTALKIVEVIN